MNPCQNCTHYVHGVDACMVHGYDYGRHLAPGLNEPCEEFDPVPEPPTE